MIMKKNLFVAAMMVAMTGCVQEANVETPQEGEKVVVEFTAGVQTKAVLDGTSVTWEEADVININGVEFTIPVVEEKAAISEDRKTAKFSAVVEPEFLQKEEFNAVYPASAYNEGNIVVPAAQNGTAKVVALATVNSIEEDLNFMHVASFFKFQVPAEVTTITLTATEALAGTINNVAFATENDVTTVSYDVVGDGDKTITLTLAEEAKFQPETYYYAAVLPGVKTNLQLSFDGKVYKTWASVDIKQSMIANVKPKAERNLAFTAAEATATMGDNSFTGLVLSGEKTGVTYTSSQTSVATVDAEGKVTLVSPGTTVITASAEENNTHLAGSVSYTLTVNPAPKTDRTISFDPSTVDLKYGETAKHPALKDVTDADVITYSIESGDDVVELTQDGVKAVKVGTATIKATVAATDTHNECSTEYTLTVNKASRTVSFDGDANVICGNEVVHPNLEGTTNNDVVTYSITEGDAATVKNNVFTLVKEGSVTVKADVKETDTHLACSATYTLTVKAADFAPVSGYIYMKPSSEWKQDNARFAAYFFNKEWKDMELVKGQFDIYQCQIPTGELNVIFCRMTPNAIANNWDNKWNQTGDLYMDAGCLYTVSGWDAGGWSLAPAVKALRLIPNDNWNKDGARFAACFMDSSKGNHTWVSMIQVPDTNEYVCVIPSGNFKYVIFCRMNPGTNNNNWDNKWNQTGDLEIPIDGKNLFTVPKGAWDGSTTSWSKKQ